jgi:flagellar basal body rod protein FlgB
MQKLSYLQSASYVASQNIANADTPGHYRKEIQPFEKLLKKNQSGRYSLKENGVTEGKQEISREEEVLRLHQINIDYQMLINTYKHYNDMILIAIGKA